MMQENRKEKMVRAVVKTPAAIAFTKPITKAKKLFIEVQ